MAMSLPRGSTTFTALRLFSRAPADGQLGAVALAAAALGVAIDRLPERNCPVGEGFATEHVGERALHHHGAAVDARTRTHLDDVVGGANGVLIMLHDDDRVADVATESFPAWQSSSRCALWGAGQCSAHRARRAFPSAPRPICVDSRNSLRLAARKRPRATVEIQIVEPDAQQQRSSRPRISPSTCRPASAPPARWLDGGKERMQLVEVHLADFVDGFARDRKEHPGRAAAWRARCGRGRCVRPSTLSSHASMPEFASPRCR